MEFHNSFTNCRRNDRDTREKSAGRIREQTCDSRCECQGGRKRPSAKTLGAVLRRYYLEIRPERISNCSNDRDTYPCHLACRLFPARIWNWLASGTAAPSPGQTKVTRPRALGGARAKSVRCTIAFVAPKLYQLQTLAASPSPMLTKH